MRRGRFRRLGMWDALPPFNGGKRRLAGLIFGAIDRIVPRATWPGLAFVDGFLGGGAVALFAKAQGFGRVIGVDIALRSAIVGQALIANSRVRLTRDDVTRVLAPRAYAPGPVERDLVPHAFTQSQARVIDNALALASDAGDPAKAALLRLLAIRIALQAHPFSYVRKGTIGRMTSGEYESITPTALPQYVRGLRLASFPQVWDLAERINRGVFEGRGDARQADLLDALPDIEADILYADPPYAATRSYEAAYKIIDRILGDEARPISPFTVQGGARMIDALLERAKHIPMVVLSFGNETVSLQELEQKMIQYRRAARAIEISYSRLAALSKGEKTGRDRELLVLGWHPETALLSRNAGLRLTEGDAVPAVALEADPGAGSAERSAPDPFALDRLEESEAALTEKRTAVRRQAIAELQAGIDQPDALLGEPSFHRDPEGIVLSPERHGSTLPWGRQEVKNEQVKPQ